MSLYDQIKDYLFYLVNDEYNIRSQRPKRLFTTNVLGQGGYGTVYKVVIGGNNSYVVKVMMITDDKDKDSFIAEADLWNELSKNDALKRFLPKLLHTDLKVFSSEGDYIISYPHGKIGPGIIGFIFQKYEAVQSLADLLIDNISNKTKISIEYGSDLFNNIITGFDKFHTAGYIHRDIKALNILVRTNQNDPNYSYPIIIDFGMACRIPCQIQTVSGTFPYMARNYFPGPTRRKVVGKAPTFPVSEKPQASHVSRLTYYLDRRVAGRESRRPIKPTRKVVQVKEIQERITPEYNIHTDNYAIGITLQQLVDIIDFGDNIERKEKMLRHVNQLKASLLGDLVAATARRNYGLAEGGKRRQTRRIARR